MVHAYYFNDPVEHCLKWILFLGRIIGVVPYTFQFKPEIRFRFLLCSLSVLHLITLTLIAIVRLVGQLISTFQRIQASNASLEELGNLEKLNFRLALVFVYFYFFKNARTIQQLLDKWSRTLKDLSLPNVDREFPKFCILITIFILGIGVTENILFDFYTVDNIDANSLLEKLVTTGDQVIPEYRLVSGNTCWTLLLLYSMKVGTYAWNFGDIFLIVVCRAITHKFKQMNVKIREHILEQEICNKQMVQECESVCVTKIYEKSGGNHVENNTNRVKPSSAGGNTKNINSKNEIIHHAIQIQIMKHTKNLCPSSTLSMPVSIVSTSDPWTEIRNNILILCQLSHEWTTLVAPLVMLCYGCNVYLIIKRIFGLLYQSKSGIDSSIYSYVSAIQFTLRVILVTFHASHVYHSTEDIVQTLERSPDSVFSETLCRLERLLDRHPVGVTIFGAFKITRKFFITILSFLFTAEIVLLQAMSASHHERDTN